MTGRVRQSLSVGIALCVLLSAGLTSLGEARDARRSKPAAGSTSRSTQRTTTKPTTTAKSAGPGSATSKKITSAGKKPRTAPASRKGKGTSSRKRRARQDVPFDPARPQTLRAQAAVVMDTRSGEIVWAKNAREPRPIASLTKLMTALVLLNDAPPQADSLTVTMEDVTGAGRSHVRAGNRVAVGDLLRCSLVSSDNAATRALARSTGLAAAEFVRLMNRRAARMGLAQTHYAEVTGLDPANESTAADQARLLHAAMQNPTIAGISSLPSYSFPCGRRIETCNNTNRLLRSRSDVVGGKTGFIRPAGYCLATLVGDRERPQLTTVVLGAPTSSSRFAESTKLINWALRLLGPSPALAEPAVGGSNRR